MFLSLCDPGVTNGQQGDPLGCDEGWEDANGYCYLFVTDKKVTFRQAEQECNRYDSSLLYIQSQAEYVSTQGQSCLYRTPVNRMKWFFIG